MFNESAIKKKKMALEALAAASDINPTLLANMTDDDLKEYAERMRLRDQSIRELVDLASQDLIQANKTLELALKASGLNPNKIEQLKKEAGKSNLAAGGAPNHFFLESSDEKKILDLIKSSQDLKSVLEMLPSQHPMAGSRISSSFGLRQHPISGRLDMHPGIDFVPEVDSQIVTPLSGKVHFAGAKGSYGNTVIINHPGGIQTLFAHMDKLYVKTGDDVAQHQIIGKAGNTGLSSGIHLHYEVRVDGKRINPLVPIAILNELHSKIPNPVKAGSK
jgi:murein DD-endopeptidase MepM/ murein hydrolase activator NlpD